jgi:F-type H+-transporting ATPase subunit gamma
VATLLELKARIRSLESIQTIARTLATVAAAKLARTRRRAGGLREQAASLRDILIDQRRALARAGVDPGAVSPLLRERAPTRTVALLVVTGDRGMCGGYNLEACRVATQLWAARRRAGQRVQVLARGRKGAAHLARQGAEVVHAEGWPRQGLAAGDADRLLGLLVPPFVAGALDEVHVAYTEFHSAIQRRPRILRLLPVALPEPAEGMAPPVARWCYEPSRGAILEELVPAYVRVQLAGALLESYASEQGARMITMQEATERAERALQECRVRHHRLRREAITTDLVSALFASAASASGERLAAAEGS